MSDAGVPAGSWPVGKDVVNALIGARRVERVPADRRQAAAELRMAEEHLEAAEEQLQARPRVAFLSAYDASRLAIQAVLTNQGLRVRAGDGGHAVLGEIAVAQLGKTPFGRFDAVRRLRNDSACPEPDREVADATDARQAVTFARAVLDSAYIAVERMHVFVG